MSVHCYFGLTESGKSYHVQNHVIPQFKKVIVFDNAHCFQGDHVRTQPQDRDFLELFRKFHGAGSYRLVIRPGRTGSVETLFNKTVHLACALGRVMPRGVDPAERVQMVTDEADFVCSPHYQSLELKHLVNKGRHDNVDSHFIARSPMRIHTDIRVNSSKIVTFRLQNASGIQLFTENFGHELAKKIKDLPKYWRFEWKDNGETAIYDQNNKVSSLFSERVGTKKQKNGGF